MLLVLRLIYDSTTSVCSAFIITYLFIFKTFCVQALYFSRFMHFQKKSFNLNVVTIMETKVCKL